MNFANNKNAITLITAVRFAESVKIDVITRYEKKANSVKRHFLSSLEANYLHFNLETKAPWIQRSTYTPEEGYRVASSKFCIISQQKQDFFDNPPQWIDDLVNLINHTFKKTYNAAFFIYHKTEKNFSLHQLPETLPGKEFALLTVGAKRSVCFEKQNSIKMSSGDLAFCVDERFFFVPKQRETLKSSQITILFQQMSMEKELKHYYDFRFLRNIKK